MKKFEAFLIIILLSFSQLLAETGEGVSEVGTLSSMSPLTSIITHGWTPDFITPEWKDYKWEFSMADAISPDRQIILLHEGRAYLSDLSYTAYANIEGNMTIDELIEDSLISETETEFNLDENRNVVIVFDWIEESAINDFGYSEAAGDALAASLIRLAETYPWLLERLHFIGHSRGTVVNSEAIQRLIYYGWQGYLSQIELDKNIHMTTLDPHPAGHWLWAPQRDDDVNSKDLNIGVSGWIGGDYSTAYIDNYYQTKDVFIGLDTYPGSAYNTNLTSPLNADYTNHAHRLVHSWYFGTIDVDADFDQFGGVEEIISEWYTVLPRNSSGFSNSFLRKNDLSAIAVSQYQLTSVQDFGHMNDSRLIFNGDFRLNSFADDKYIQGWNLQGGEGHASVYFTHLDLNMFTPSKTHNYFYIAKDKIYFSARVIKKSLDDQLQVSVLDNNNEAIATFKPVPLTWYTFFKNYSIDVSEYKGSVKKLKFEIINDWLAVDSEVLIDNVSFENYEEIEAVIVLNSENSAGNLLKTASVEGAIFLHAYDYLGNHTGQIDDSTWATEIPGSYYYESMDSVEQSFKALYLPKPEAGQEFTFKFESQGAVGNVDFIVNDFSSGEGAVSVSFDSVQISGSTIAEISLSQADSSSALEVDSDGDGNVDITLSPSNLLQNFEIVAIHSGGGSIYPANTTVILGGDSITYSIVPDSGYVISNVIVDGLSLGSLTTYGFNAIDSNHTINAEFSESTGLRGDNTIPLKFHLEQNHPNPFNPSTEISFSLAQASFVELEVYNALGQKVTTLITRKMNSGYHQVKFHSEGLSSGVYYYRLVADDFVSVRKMLLIR